MDYREYLQAMLRPGGTDGMDVPADTMSPHLFDWQRRIVSWALKVGRAAIWADTGLGKTRMQLEWCRHIPGVRLIIAPLAVCGQTVDEATAIGMHAAYAAGPDDIDKDGVWLTNYERAERFDPSRLSAVVLDEASILKNCTGTVRTMLVHRFHNVPYRLACTATPAPNDPEELTSQAEFLGHSTRARILATYFTTDKGTNGWRLKGHAKVPFMRWLSQWAVALSKPSDIGGDDTGYDLPGLHVSLDVTDWDGPDDGGLWHEMGGVADRHRVRRESVPMNVARTAELVNPNTDQWVIWCGLNAEADGCALSIPGAVNVSGSMSPEDKAREFRRFQSGQTRVLVTKPRIAAFGLNLQGCHRMAFCGIDDSWESYYQAVRRCYRFGQSHVVDVHIVCTEPQVEVADNVRAKGTQAMGLTRDLVATMNQDNTI